MKKKCKPRISVVSSYVPRECGLATYSYDLYNAFNDLKSFEPAKIVAVNDHESTYDYPDDVKMQIEQNNLNTYLYTADFLNDYSDIVHLQHEYGLFSGPAGGYIIPFLKRIHIPVVTTFHTVLTRPPKLIHKITKEIAEYSTVIHVMAENAKGVLRKQYGIDREKIHVIHHGVHDVPFMSGYLAKKKLNLENRDIIMTFGLLNEGKGIEYVLKALPDLVEEFPQLLYLVIGETHPEIRMKEGEIYRHKLMKIVEKNGLVDHVKFQNRYLALEEVLMYLHACDVYITPYIYSDQVSSGTLAYAIGTGKAIISTPYIYAKEILKGKRGLMVKHRDVNTIYKRLRYLLRSEKVRNDMSWNAYQLGREMIWPEVAKNHAALFHNILGYRESETPVARVASKQKQ